MSNQYFGYKNQYSAPVGTDLQLNTQHMNEYNNQGSYKGISVSPTFANVSFPDNASSISSTSSSSGGYSFNSNMMSGSNLSFQNPRLRYYMSKSFDAEDDLEFCPEIPENYETPLRKFNPYTASVFSPQDAYATSPRSPIGSTQSPRTRTPRLKKPLEIVNPQLKLRVTSSSK